MLTGLTEGSKGGLLENCITVSYKRSAGFLELIRFAKLNAIGIQICS